MAPAPFSSSVSRALLLVALAVCGACEEEPCRGSLEKGASLDVEIIEKWDQGSRFTFEAPSEESADFSDLSLPSCQIDDVKPGSLYRWKIEDVSSGHGSSGCYEALCPDDFPTPSVSLSSNRTLGVNQGAFVCISPDRITKLDGCELGRFVGLMKGDETVDLFDEPTIGKRPPAVIVRRLVFGPENPELQCADPMSVFPNDAMMSDPGGDYWECADAWVVHVKKR